MSEADVDDFVWGKAYKNESYDGNYKLIFEICHHIRDTRDIFLYFNGAKVGRVTENLVERTYHISFHSDKYGYDLWWENNKEHNQKIIDSRIIPMFGKVPTSEPFEFRIPRSEFVERCREWYRKEQGRKRKEEEDYITHIKELKDEMWKNLSDSNQGVISKEKIQGCALPENSCYIMCHKDDFDTISTIFDLILESKELEDGLMTVVFQFKDPGTWSTTKQYSIFRKRKKALEKLLGIEWGWPVLSEEWHEFCIPRQEILDFTK